MTNTYRYEGFGSLSEWNGQMSSAGAIDQYAAIAATGANVISLSPRLWTADGSANAVAANQDKTESDASVVAGIRAAQAAGIDVILRPHVTGLDGTPSYYLTPSDAHAFFASYKDQIVHYAAIAQQTGVSAFSIGNEMGGLVGDQYKSEWLDIIAAVRSVYDGQVTYSAALNEAKYVSFWDKLDTIGVNAYASLSNTTNPTVAELKAAWDEVPVNDYWASVMDSKSPVDFIRSLSETYGKQVLLTEVGYRSIDGAATDPGQWYRDGAADVTDQTNAYQAFLETWTAEGGSWLQGYNLWSWELDGRSDPTGYSIIGKPAEQLVKQYFSGAGATYGLNVNGSVTNDLIDLGRGADHINAGLGNDVIRAGAGDDVIVAGPGTIERLATTTVTFTAFGTAAGGQQAQVQLRVNGQLVGTAITLKAASDVTDYQTYTVTFANPDEIRSLDFDLINATPGRAAFFKGIFVNGYELSASDVTNASAPGTFQLYVNTIRLDGTAHSELFYGAGSDNDLIEGGKGDDTIDGGAGIDTAVYSGSYADYALKLNGNTLSVADSVAGRDGTDALKNVEFLQFSDRTVAVSSLNLSGATPAPLLMSAALGKVDAGAAPDLVVKGGSVANATVTLYDKGVAVGSAVAGSNGAYAINVADLADGVHALTLVASSGGVASAATSAGVMVVGKAAAIVGLLGQTSVVPNAVWITDGQPVSLSIAEFGATREAFSHAVTPYSLSVQDTAANVLANLDRLSMADDISAIVLKGGTIFNMASPLAVTKAIAAYGAVFDKISGDYAFEVSGVGTGGALNLGHYDETGALVWQTTTTTTPTGKIVYTGYADGHSVQTNYNASGVKLTEVVRTGSGSATTDYVVVGKPYASQLTVVENGVTTATQYRADGTVYAKLAFGADGGRTTDSYDVSGALTQHAVVASSGATSTTTYVSGAVKQLTETEVGGAKHITDYAIAAKPYVSQTIDYNAAGKAVATTQRLANGDVYAKIAYGADGSRTTDIYDASGKVAQHVVVASNGATSTTNYVSGVARQLTVVDANGARHVTDYGVTGKSYATQTTDYDVSGNGVLTTQQLASGALYAKIAYGANGARTTDIYDASGKVVQNVVVASSGATTTTSYVSGVARQLTVVDPNGARHVTDYGVTGKPYATQTTDYDASGNAVLATQKLASGTLYGKTAYGSDGSRTSDIYDASGKIVQHVVVSSAGATSTSSYAAGVEKQRTVVDIDGSKHTTDFGVTGKSYTSQTTDYDASGATLGVTQNRADGSVYAKIAYASNGSTTDYYGKNGAIIEHVVIAGAVTNDTVYNADGSRATLTVTDASGRHETTYGITGKPYDQQTAHFDAARTLLRVEQHNIDGTTSLTVNTASSQSSGVQSFDSIKSYVTYTLGEKTAPALYLVGTAAINATGDAAANALYGNAAANTLTGLGGNDILDGGAGADTMIGGLGNDTYYVDNVGDKVIEAAGQGVDTVYSAIAYSLAGQALENLVFIGGGNGNLTGNELDNTLTGNDAMNVIDGGAGADTMIGGGSNDTYYVDNAGDRVIETAGGGNDLVYSSVSFSLAGQEIEKLTLTGSTAINATGNELANTIVGNAGANVIAGGLGADTLTGGAGADVFVFNTALGASNIDRITDFTPGSDKIQLDSAIFTALAKGALNADAFWIGAAAHDATDRIIYNKQTGALFYDDDGNGAHAAQQFAIIAGGLTGLSQNDFTIV